MFEGKLYLTRLLMHGGFIPQNLKLPKPKAAPKPQHKALSSGDHVQLFRMVYHRVTGFQAEHLQFCRKIGFSCSIACGNMAVNRKVHAPKDLLVFACVWQLG